MPTIAETTKDKTAPDKTDKPKQADPIGENALAFMDQSIAITGRKKKEAKDGKDDKDVIDKLDEGDEAPPKKKPAAKLAALPAQQQPIDEDKLGEAVGRAVGKAMEKREKSSAPAEPELPAEVKAELKTHERLEKHFPDKYKGHPDKFLTNVQKWADYSEKWEADHPGQDFIDDDPEHKTFRDALEAETHYDEDDNVAALADEIADAKVAKATKDFEQQLAPIRRREKLAEKREEIVSNRDKVGDRFWQRMGEQFATVLDDNGQLNPKALAELKTSDPDAHDAAVNGAAFVENMATTAFLLDNALLPYKGDLPISPQTPKEEAAEIRQHAYLSQFASDAEQRMAARPADKQMDDQGRIFLARALYYKLAQKERERHWTFSFEDLGYLIAAQVAKQTQAHLQSEEEKFSARARARGLLADGNAPRGGNRQVATKRANDDEQDVKPLSPTTPMTPRLASARGKSAAGANSPEEAWLNRGVRGR